MKNKKMRTNKEGYGLLIGLIAALLYWILDTRFGAMMPFRGVLNVPSWCVSFVLWATVFNIFAGMPVKQDAVEKAVATRTTQKDRNPAAQNVKNPIANSGNAPIQDAKIKKLASERSKMTLDMIAGYKTTKDSMRFMVECLKNPEKLTSVGAKMPSGILLYGPPGTGKTMFAKAVAGEAGVPFFSVSGSDFMEKYVGVGAQRVRELFAKARHSMPCIVFIDEIDGVGKSRDGNTNEERQQTLNQLLVEMADAASSNSGIMVMASTNSIESLDSALTRPGRFDRKIAVPLPNMDDRLAILHLHAGNKKVSADVNMSKIAQMTSGMSGADLATLINEAAIQAVYHGRDVITSGDLDVALFQMMTGGEKSEIANPEDLRIVAYHEAGHAVVTKLVTNDEVPQVSIIGSTSGALGYTMRYSAGDTLFMTKKQLEGRIQSLYGGRAAEEILFGSYDNVTTGASNDLKRATKLIRDYFSVYGMGEDTIYTDGVTDIDAKGKELANRLYKETIDLLRANRSVLDKMAGALMEKKTLTSADVDALVGKE